MALFPELLIRQQLFAGDGDQISPGRDGDEYTSIVLKDNLITRAIEATSQDRCGPGVVEGFNARRGFGIIQRRMSAVIATGSIGTT
jgi:hypothetical protein